MFVLRLILLVLAAVLVRRLVRRAFVQPSRRVDGPTGGPGAGRRRPDPRGQEISDADFEEIP